MHYTLHTRSKNVLYTPYGIENMVDTLFVFFWYPFLPRSSVEQRALSGTKCSHSEFKFQRGSQVSSSRLYLRSVGNAVGEGLENIDVSPEACTKSSEHPKMYYSMIRQCNKFAA